MRMFLLAISTVLVGCAVEHVAPEADTAFSELAQISKGGKGWAKIQGSWDPIINDCTFCESIPSGSIQTFEVGNCTFNMKIDHCVCVGDDPGENTYGLQNGCYCEGVVTQINHNPNGACAEADLLGGGGVLSGD